MEYLDRIERAIDFIEGHLGDPLPVGEVAAQAYLSVPHLYRVFPVMTGCTVGQYIRKRRLSRSAHELRSTHKRVLDIALDFGFESEESYIRAFQLMFGITPGRYRKSTEIIAVYNAVRLSPLQRTEGVPMQPEIVKRKLLLAGVEAKVDLRSDFSGVLSVLGGTLRQNLPLIRNKAVPARKVGIWLPDPDEAGDETSARRIYFAGVELTGVGEVPPALIAKDLPESLFARFREASRGTISRFAYAEWLPASGYLLNIDILPGDFEIFDDMEHDGSNDGCDILLPIRTA